MPSRLSAIRTRATPSKRSHVSSTGRRLIRSRPSAWPKPTGCVDHTGSCSTNRKRRSPTSTPHCSGTLPSALPNSVVPNATGSSVIPTGPTPRCSRRRRIELSDLIPGLKPLATWGTDAAATLSTPAGAWLLVAIVWLLLSTVNAIVGWGPTVEASGSMRRAGVCRRRYRAARDSSAGSLGHTAGVPLCDTDGRMARGGRHASQPGGHGPHAATARPTAGNHTKAAARRRRGVLDSGLPRWRRR